MSKLFNPDHLKHLCQKYGFRPSKIYGQNFLINEEVVEQIVESANIKKTDTIVEIGPGFGPLTFALAKQAKKVIAFEIEKKLLDYWSDKKPSNVEIIWGNALKSSLFKSDKLEGGIDSTPALLLARGGRYKVVANLPYQITSPIIRAFLETNNPPTQMTFMIQKETAERICAEPGDMSILSVAVQYYAEPKIIDKISRSNFWPEPKVDSAIIQLSLRAPVGGTAISGDCFASLAMTNYREKFFQLVKAGFANRRKLLIKNLEPIIGKKNKQKIREAFVKMGIKETVRAQELSIEQWNFLTKEL